MQSLNYAFLYVASHLDNFLQIKTTEAIKTVNILNMKL